MGRRYRDEYNEEAAAGFERAVGRELGRARSRAGIEMGAAAMKAGVEIRTIAAMECGDRGVRLGTVYLAARAVGVELSDLVKAAEKAGEG